jgi:SAM-dependent methyltransferase
VLNNPEEYRRMAEVESRHWWFRALHRLVANTLLKHPLGRAARIVDAGCGTGGLLIFLRERGFQQLSGFDVSPDALAISHQRELPVRPGDLRQADQLVEPVSCDAIISNDTLYFFNSAEQERTLKHLADALAPNGLLIVNLPALRAFRGTHDLSVGITRRFTKREARRLFTSTGLSIVSIRFWPFLLSPFIYAVRVGQRTRLRQNSRCEMRSDIALPPALLNWVLEFVTRIENAVLPWKPFGSSLLVVAQKPSSAP